MTGFSFLMVVMYVSISENRYNACILKVGFKILFQTQDTNILTGPLPSYKNWWIILKKNNLGKSVNKNK